MNRKKKKKDALQARNEIWFNPAVNSHPDLNSPDPPQVQVWSLIWPVTNKNESHETPFWIQNSLQFLGVHCWVLESVEPLLDHCWSQAAQKD